jgi:TolB-like protein
MRRRFPPTALLWVLLATAPAALPAAALAAPPAPTPAPSAPAEAERPLLVVMDLQSLGATDLQSQAASSGAVRGLRQLDVFQVLSAEDVRQLLAIERTRQLAGLSAEGVGSLARSLGARHAVVGSLSRVESQLRLELRLLDTQEGKVVAQKAHGPVQTFEDVARAVPDLAQELVAPLLQAQQGGLLVQASEEASEVLVDDVLVASTPMTSAHKLSRGAHRLTVRKDGFIAQARTVRVEPDQTAVEAVTLLPSPDFAQSWQRRYGPQRLLAWASAGVAVAALGGALALDRLGSESLYRNEFLPRQLTLTGADADAVAQANLSAPQDTLRVQCGLDVTACQQAAAASQQRLRTQQWVTAGMAGLGALATAGSLYWFFTGEDPGRYSGLVASPLVTGGGGAGLALGGSF